MTYAIDEIEGIGPAYKQRLAQAGICDLEQLLAQCGTQRGRSAVAQSTGIGEGQLLSWANMADLMRIRGIGRQFAELLHAAGVDTVAELAQRRADNLSARMESVNAERRLAKATPSPKQVEVWIQLAGTLQNVISH